LILSKIKLVMTRARRELGPGAESGRGRTGHQGHPVEVLDEGSSLVFSPLSL
jgi:hypothetical protein